MTVTRSCFKTEKQIEIMLLRELLCGSREKCLRPFQWNVVVIRKTSAFFKGFFVCYRIAYYSFEYKERKLDTLKDSLIYYLERGRTFHKSPPLSCTLAVSSYRSCFYVSSAQSFRVLSTSSWGRLCIAWESLPRDWYNLINYILVNISTFDV